MLARVLVLRQNKVLMGGDSLPVSVSPFVIDLSLSLLLLLQAVLVPGHHFVVGLTSLSYLIRKLAMLVGDIDLFL